MKKTIKLLAIFVILAAFLTGCGAESGQTSTHVTTVEPKALVLWEGKALNTLTGEYTMAGGSGNHRRVAVMVNNLPAALPQYGVGSADIIFEIPMEAYLTRLMCIYPDFEAVPYIVSVRSYRSYFAAVSCGFDAVYVHWGQDESMMDYYYSLGMDTYNGMWNTTLFGRDQGRLDAGYSLEHTSSFDGTRLAAQMTADGVRTTVDEAHSGPVFRFNSSSDTLTYEGIAANYVNINFGSTSAQLTYDEDSEKYLKSIDNSAQVDGMTGDRLSFTNVIILCTDIYKRDDNVHLSVNVIGSGMGVYITGGTCRNITWSKENENSQFVFCDEEGNELEMNRGKTYIAITTAGTYSIE